MKKLLVLIAVCGVATILSCSKDEATTINEPDALTRNAGVGDSADTDSGKIRIGDLVIDTTWNGETHINF